MKVNISTLMSIISEEDKNLNNLIQSMRGHLINTKIQELDGRENVIEDYKSDFELELKEFEKQFVRITTLKNILFEKNNSYKLSDGRSIQQAISDNSYLRRIKSFYEIILTNRASKRRITEVNNSYFECHILNFDIGEIKEKLKKVDLKIQQTDFEISKLNSEQFEIDI